MGKPDRLIRKPVVLDRTGGSNAWLYKMIAEGSFPKQVHIGGRAVAWLESEVDEWIQARLAERG
ncbi:MAG: hypothetical protein VR73_10280 [Gammaproteobacteria bacterium BRH_c0]|jgi:prophage regulatory protein|nr:MAG: hypothetical protein VR73_10280 [Gammaproteobacteria bacterium BRH_c0]